MATVANDNRRPLTGRTVLLCFLGFFGLVTAVNAIMIFAAVSTFGGVEAASSYQAGLAFSRESAAAQAQAARHWSVTARVRPDGQATRVDVDARGTDGAPITGLTATARLIHPADARADHPVALSELSAGTFRGTTVPVTGQWDVIIELSRDGERLFRSRNRVVLN